MRVATPLCLTAAALLIGACGGGSDTKVLFPRECTNPVYKPSQIVVTCADANTVVHGVSWAHYGDKTASGSGAAKINDCVPDCAAGKFKTYPVLVKLSNPTDCGNGRTQFTHLVMSYTGAKPGSAGSTISEDFPCNGP